MAIRFGFDNFESKKYIAVANARLGLSVLWLVDVLAVAEGCCALRVFLAIAVVLVLQAD